MEASLKNDFSIGMILQEHVSHMLKDSVPPRRAKRVGPKVQHDDEGHEETSRGARNEDIESEDEDEDGDEGVGEPETG